MYIIYIESALSGTRNRYSDRVVTETAIRNPYYNKGQKEVIKNNYHNSRQPFNNPFQSNNNDNNQYSGPAECYCEPEEDM